MTTQEGVTRFTRLTRYCQETGQICVLVMQIDMADPLSTRPGGVRFRRW